MNLEVLIMGDLNFATEVMHGVARLFMGPNEASFHQATGVVLVIMLLFSSIKYFIDPEKSPYPFKEFLYGLVAWIIFVGPVSPRFDVTLQSYHDPLAVRTVNDIPLLAAVPAWATSNLLGGLRELMQDSFSPVGFAAGDDVDPLGALVKLHNASLPYSASNGNSSSDIDFSRSLRNYIRDCYLMEQENSPSQAGESIQKIQSRPLDDLLPAIRVNTSHYATMLYLDPSTPEGSFTNCQTAHTNITTYANNNVRDSLADSYERIGVTENSLLTGQQLLTGGAGPIANPYDLMVNRFVLWHLGEGLQESGYKSPWISKMLSEATTNRAYKSAAERAMFLEYVLPLTSMFEMFAFYIAPIMMILAVMGGIGWGMLSKYMYLLLFVNLWGFIKVFVDLYTYLAAEKAFDVIAVTDNPFTVANFSGTITEVESLLGVASNMTSAIPLLAMFLLYGGVHSLMGVMREMDPSGKGSVKADNMAPSVASPWNNGSMNMANENLQSNLRDSSVARGTNAVDNGWYGSGSVGNSFSGAFSSTEAVTAQTTESYSKSYMESATNLVEQMRSEVQGENGQWNISSNDDYMAAQTVQLADMISRNTTLSDEEAAVAAYETMQSYTSTDKESDSSTGGWSGGANLGLSAAGSALNLIGGSWKQESTDTEESAKQLGYTEKDSDTEKKTFTQQDALNWAHKIGNDFNFSEKFSTGEGYTVSESTADQGRWGDSWQAVEQEQRNYMNSVSEQESLDKKFSSNDALNNNLSLNKAGVGALVNGEYGMFEDFYNNLTDQQQARLSEGFGIDNADDILTNYKDQAFNQQTQSTDAFKVMDLFMQDLQQQTSTEGGRDNTTEQVQDLAMMKGISDTIVDYGAANSTVGEQSETLQGYRELSSSLGDVISGIGVDQQLENRGEYIDPNSDGVEGRGRDDINASNTVDTSRSDLSQFQDGAMSNSEVQGRFQDQHTQLNQRIADGKETYKEAKAEFDESFGNNVEQLDDSQTAELYGGADFLPKEIEHGSETLELVGFRGDAASPYGFYYQNDTTKEMFQINTSGEMKTFWGDTEDFDDFTGADEYEAAKNVWMDNRRTR